MDHVQAGPTPDSFVYIEGQNMTFVCNATPTSETLNWVVELTRQKAASGALALANAQPRIETTGGNNNNPSTITILNAMLTDSNTTVTCKDGAFGNVSDVVTLYVEGEQCCMHVCVCVCVCCLVVASHFLNVSYYRIQQLCTYVIIYSSTSHIQEVWDQGVPIIVKVPVTMNPLLPVWTLRHSTL